MSTPNRYVPGFRLLNEYSKKRKYPIGNGVAVAIGDLLILTSGYIALGTTLQGILPAGVANYDCTAAEATSNGAFNVEVIPCLQEYDFIVPCEATGAIAQTDVASLFDLQSEDGIDEADSVTLGMGFFVDAIDISTAALAASSTYGFAIGHFEYIAAS
jgi:hypothetical protein